MMKKRIAALVTAGVLALSMLTGCGSKQESWKVTCPWAPSGVAAMVSQKAAAKSPDYSDNKITLVAEAVKGDAATVNTWVSSTKANDKELVFAGEGLFAITETLDPLSHAAVLFPRGDLTTETHLFPVFDIVLFEEFQQRFLLYSDTEVGIPQFGGRDIAVRLHQLLIVAVHLDADFIDGKIDLHGLDALARRPAVLDIP